jgi:hypothetical protein
VPGPLVDEIDVEPLDFGDELIDQIGWFGTGVHEEFSISGTVAENSL